MSSERPRRSKQRRYDPLAVLAYIATYRQRNSQRTPSQRHIQAALGISARSVVHNIIQRLERAELLTITDYGRGLPVDLTLTEAGEEAVRRWQAEQAGGEKR